LSLTTPRQHKGQTEVEIHSFLTSELERSKFRVPEIAFTFT